MAGNTDDNIGDNANPRVDLSGLSEFHPLARASFKAADDGDSVWPVLNDKGERERERCKFTGR